MLYPSIDILTQKADSKYSIVVLAAKRARQLLDKNDPTVEPTSRKVIGIALEELAAGTLYAAK